MTLGECVQEGWSAVATAVPAAATALKRSDACQGTGSSPLEGVVIALAVTAASVAVPAVLYGASSVLVEVVDRSARGEPPAEPALVRSFVDACRDYFRFAYGNGNPLIHS